MRHNNGDQPNDSTAGVVPPPVFYSGVNTDIPTTITGRRGKLKSITRPFRWFQRERMSASGERVRLEAIANAPPIACPVCGVTRSVTDRGCRSCPKPRRSAICTGCKTPKYPTEISSQTLLCVECWHASLTAAESKFLGTTPERLYRGWMFPECDNSDNPSILDVREAVAKPESPEETARRVCRMRWHRQCASDYWAEESAAVETANGAHSARRLFPPPPEDGNANAPAEIETSATYGAEWVPARRVIALWAKPVWVRHDTLAVNGWRLNQWDFAGNRHPRAPFAVLIWKWKLAPEAPVGAYNTSGGHWRHAYVRVSRASPRGMVRCTNKECHAADDWGKIKRGATTGGRWTPAISVASPRTSTPARATVHGRARSEGNWAGFCDDCHLAATWQAEALAEARAFPRPAEHDRDDYFAAPRPTTDRGWELWFKSGGGRGLKTAQRQSRLRSPFEHATGGWGRSPSVVYFEHLETHGLTHKNRRLRTGRKPKPTGEVDFRQFDRSEEVMDEDPPPLLRRHQHPAPRRAAPEASGDGRSQPDVRPTLLDNTIKTHFSREHAAAMASMNSHERAVYHARFVRGLLLREIAALYHTSPSSVSHTIRRILEGKGRPGRKPVGVFEAAGIPCNPRHVAAGRGRRLPTKKGAWRQHCAECSTIRVPGECYCRKHRAAFLRAAANQGRVCATLTLPPVLRPTPLLAGYLLDATPRREGTRGLELPLALVRAGVPLPLFLCQPEPTTYPVDGGDGRTYLRRLHAYSAACGGLPNFTLSPAAALQKWRLVNLVRVNRGIGALPSAQLSPLATTPTRPPTPDASFLRIGPCAIFLHLRSSHSIRILRGRRMLPNNRVCRPGSRKSTSRSARPRGESAPRCHPDTSAICSTTGDSTQLAARSSDDSE